MKCARIESKLRNIFSRSRFSPVTLEIWNIGHTLSKKKIKDYCRGKTYNTFVTVIMTVIVCVNVIVKTIVIVIIVSYQLT